MTTKTTTPRVLATLGLALILGLLIAGVAWAERPVSETRPLAPDGILEIHNIAGSVTVIGGASQVEITGTLGDDVEKLELTGGGDRLEVRVKTPRHSQGRQDLAADLVIRAPAGARLEVETVSASIDVEGMDDRLELESVSGNVHCKTQPRLLSIETVSGEIRSAGALEWAEVESVSGKLDLGSVSGRLEASTVSGAISVTGGTLEEGRFSSVSGRVEIATDLVPGGDLEIEGHSGGVVLDLPPGVSATFDVETYSGDIDNQLGPPAERTSEYGPGKSLEFTLGDGAARVEIESFSGQVTIR